ncbi:PREDICTED: beta-1,4-galactosyltransferase galt-1-like [Amphimedon queenslandica]|uniref:Glycosyltransferase family 92 protein n=1 Tax=Amphimedon queenslandica TaxID=400682 RepID=A0A1X7VVN8_AMPQE|nr:PREDICTED: beta-1,4-galactosyltransferase galt-1-like [Amphimedon queenslandica]|eukprot:XP_011410557.1 PREDICTED: beta-1,4-galactosyltransferase galt-1-like [Amphimedon queenslandica]
MGSSKVKTMLGFVLFLLWLTFMMLLVSISKKRQTVTGVHQDLHQIELPTVPKEFSSITQHSPRPSSEPSVSSSIKTTPVTSNPTSKATIATTVYHNALPDVSWVPLWSENTSQLWGERAYIDDRAAVHKNPVVVLIGFKESRAERVRNGYRWFCHITYSKNVTPICTGLVNIDQLEYQFANNHGWSLPSFFICPLTASIDDHPLKVALTANSCKSRLHSHLIPITGTSKSKPLKTVGICLHKALFGLTDPQLIIQFIETHKLFGVSLFTIYIQEVSNGVRDILYRYSQEGIVDVVEWRINITMDVRDYGQVGVIHDCLYRNKNRVKFLGFLDIDELFVPKNQRKQLPEVLEGADKPHLGSFRFSHVFMHNGSYESSLQEPVCSKVHVPVYFQRYKRSNYDESVGVYDKLGSKTKIFVKPNAIVRMGRHSMRLRPIHKFAPGFNEFAIPGHMGLLFHYRHIIDGKYERRPLVKDLTMSQFRDDLMDTINSKLCVT